MTNYSSMNNKLIDKLNDTIEENLQNEQFGVVQLAEAADLSKSQLNRRLQVITGQSSSRYIREYRLKKAMELLQNQAATSTEVAYQVGFGSPSYFSTCFKQYYGFSPNEAGNQDTIAVSNAGKTNWKKISLISLGSILMLSLVYSSFSSRLSNNHTNTENQPRIRIAVLPVKNYPDSSANRHPYLIGENITSKLSKIDEFAVKESAFAQNIDMREVGPSLNADFLLGIKFVPAEESFELAANLTDANDGTVIWSELYQRTNNDLQEIQNEVVLTVTKVLGVNITSIEANRVKQKLTHSDAAYRYFLVGNDFLARLQTEGNMRMAADLFEKAVALDSTFAEAWFGLFGANSVLYGRYYDRSEAQYQRVQQYFEKAKSLGPELPDVKLHISRKMEASERLPFLKDLLREYPENDEIYKRIGAAYGELGQRDSALYYVEKAIEFNPTDSHHWIIAGIHHRQSRRYSKALAYYLEALELQPTLKLPHPAFIYVDIGELAKARDYLTPVANEGSKFSNTFKRDLSHIEYLDRNFQEALALMVEVDSITTNYHSQYRTRSLELGLIYYGMGDLQSARTQFELARIEMDKKLEEVPDDPRVLCSLGIAYAGLGLKQEAITSFERALSIAQMPDRSAHPTNNIERNLAKVYVMVGKYDQALKQLEYLLEDGRMHVWRMKLDPIYDPIRETEGFKELVNNIEYQPVL